MSIKELLKLCLVLIILTGTSHPEEIALAPTTPSGQLNDRQRESFGFTGFGQGGVTKSGNDFIIEGEGTLQSKAPPRVTLQGGEVDVKFYSGEITGNGIVKASNGVFDIKSGKVTMSNGVASLHDVDGSIDIDGNRVSGANMDFNGKSSTLQGNAFAFNSVSFATANGNIVAARFSENGVTVSGSDIDVTLKDKKQLHFNGETAFNFKEENFPYLNAGEVTSGETTFASQFKTRIGLDDGKSNYYNPDTKEAVARNGKITIAGAEGDISAGGGNRPVLRGNPINIFLTDGDSRYQFSSLTDGIGSVISSSQKGENPMGEEKQMGRVILNTPGRSLDILPIKDNKNIRVFIGEPPSFEPSKRTKFSDVESGQGASGGVEIRI